MPEPQVCHFKMGQRIMLPDGDTAKIVGFSGNGLEIVYIVQKELSGNIVRIAELQISPDIRD